MPFVDAGRNAMLNALTALAVYCSLHTADPTAGSNEVTGGSPAYARKAITFAAAASGAAAQNGTAPVFDVPAATTVVAVGFWSASTGGTFYGWSPLNGGVVFPFYAAASSDLLTVDAHGYSAHDQVYVTAVSGSSLPTGIVAGTIYFVENISGDTFQLAATSGGSAINLTADGMGVIQKVVPESFGSQGTLTQSAATLRLTA